MEAVATPSSKTDTLLSSYSLTNNHSNSGSKPPVLQIPLPLRSPKQHALVIHDETQSSKANRLPQTNVDAGRSRRKNSKKSGGGGGTPTCTTSDVLRLMDSLGLSVPPDIYASLVQECTLTADSTAADELHRHISRSGLRVPLCLVNRLLLMHVSCGHMDIARQLFDRMTLKNFISWAILIVGYASDARYDEAISLFAKMQDRFSMLETPSWIIVCVLEACVSTTNMGLGKQIHACLHKFGIANHDLFLTSSLIEFYGKLECIEGSDFVFNQLSRHNTMTWTARIIGSCREEHFRDVFSYFKEMGSAGIKKSAFTFSSVLRACGRVDDDGKSGRQVHANAVKLGLDRDSFVQCGLVDMYGRNRLLRDARLMFERVDDKRNVAYWNAMMAGYMRNGVYIEAIKLLYQMKAAGVQPPESLINEVRIACGNDQKHVNGQETLQGNGIYVSPSQTKTDSCGVSYT